MNVRGCSSFIFWKLFMMVFMIAWQVDLASHINVKGLVHMHQHRDCMVCMQM